jgi:lipopolysaccharide/colanic/teichoic acid biosynthesis glycosyltransferase
MPIDKVRVKRVFDLVAGSMLSLACCPVVALLAVTLRIILGRPVIFSHERIGLHGKPFQFYKFRTMTDARDSCGILLPDEQRLTALGRFLRSNSLDELPQLWNVLKGDMSLVGPRPLLPEYLPRYTPFQRRRHEVKPGMTGWPQVNGRNALTWEEKFDLDVWYVDHCSLWLDIKILCLTLLKVLQRDGISQHGHATMPEFVGTADVTGPHE